MGRLVRGVLVAVSGLFLVASAATASAASIPSSGAISAGSNFTCGIRTDGTLVCWGDNGSGQVNPPAGLPAGTFSQISSGFSHACAIRTDANLVCWGDNTSGQATPPAGTFSQVSAGNGFTCAVKTDQTLTCWGATPTAGVPPGTFSQVSSGGFGACGIRTDATLVCWGLKLYNLISGTPGGTFSQVSAGYFHTCGVRTDGTVTCWGNNSSGQAPALVDGKFIQVSSGGRDAIVEHTCGLRIDGTLACWGDNSLHQVDATPTAGTFSQVSSGGAFSCAIGTDGTLVCWGDNGSGQVSPLPTGGLGPPADTTPPVIAPLANITAEATGPSGAVVTYAVSATDPDDAAIVSCMPASGSTFPLGLTTVACTATDTHGNAASASFTVTVRDTTPPVVTIYAPSPVEATGPSGAVVTFTVIATDGVTTSPTTSCLPASGTTFLLGTTTITCTATDAAGNIGTATATVVVQDTTAPAVTISAPSTVEATGPSGAVVNFTASATDAVTTSPTTSCLPASGTTFALGTTTITCSAADTAGNTSTGTATVLVQDTTAPAVTITAPSTVEATGPSGAVVTFTVIATDAVTTSPTTSCLPASGTTFALGSTTITCSAKDAAGNVGTATATVLVHDTTPPVVTISVTSPVEATGPSGAAVIFVATATDAVSGSPATSCTPLSGSTFPLGTTTITCSATDGASNTGTATATVLVEDKTAPTLSLPANITAVATSASGAVVTYTVSATDPDNLTSDLTMSCSPPSGSTFPAGVTTVTCTATDPAGNTSTGSFQVAVVDFSMGPISAVTVPVGGTASTSVTINSVSGFSSAVALSASGAPAGVSVTFNPTSVTPTSGGSATSTLTVHLSPMATPTTFTLIVTGTFEGVSHTSTASVTVTVSSPAIADVVGQLQLAGCIDNAGIANALTAKLTAEQGAIGGGNTKTAINILKAFTDQVRAQSGKHITADCATVLMIDGRSLIDSLAVSATPNPITGSVRTASGSGISGAILTLQDSAGTTVATATTDITGFYFFATTGLLTPGATYTVTVAVPGGLSAPSAASQTFTWSGGAELSLADFTTI